MSVNPPLQHEGARRIESSPQEESKVAAYARVRSLLPVVTAIYLFLSVKTFWLTQEDGVTLGFYSLAAAGMMTLATWMVVRRDRVKPEQVHSLLMFVSAIAVGQALISLRIEPDSAAGPALSLVMLMSGAIAVSLSWHVLIAGVSFIGWTAVALAVLPSKEFWYWAVVLLFTAGLSAFRVHYRSWKTRQAVAAISPPPKEQFEREFLDRAVEGTRDGLWYWELKSDVFHFSEAWSAMLGFTPAELAKHPDEWMNRVHPGYVARLRSDLAAHLRGDEPQFRNEHRMRRKDGTYMWVLARGTLIRDKDGESVALAGSHSDITPLIEVEKRLLTDTFKDQLTGLANRSFLLSHLDMAVEERVSRGPAGSMFAVLFLDLDRFKFINDTMGHHVGDELLIAVAGRLRNCARPDDVVARFGGDEFVVLLRNLHDADEAMQVGHRMLKALMTPFHLGEREIQSGGSIGIALSREEFRKSDEILHFGDIAMYQSKKLGKGRVTLFHRGMLEETSKQEKLQSELEQAVERGQLVLHYQPSIHLATGKIVGAEALLRWQRESGELLYPADFLPLAEKSDLIQHIGEWALRTACAQNSAWQRAGALPVRMSVNLSARQLQQTDLTAIVKSALADAQLHPDFLELEMTEAALMRNLEQATGTLKALGDSGIRTAIDNFGTGHSSLSHLRQFPFQTLKMDRNFVSELTTDRKAAAVARGIITMAHSLGLSVVAEGVEKKDQFHFLSAERCDNVQGFLTGRPVPGEELLKLLQAQAPLIVTPPPVTVETDLSSLNEMRKATGASVALKWAAERKARQ